MSVLALVASMTALPGQAMAEACLVDVTTNTAAFYNSHTAGTGSAVTAVGAPTVTTTNAVTGPFVNPNVVPGVDFPDPIPDTPPIDFPPGGPALVVEPGVPLTNTTFGYVPVNTSQVVTSVGAPTTTTAEFLNSISFGTGQAVISLNKDYAGASTNGASGAFACGPNASASGVNANAFGTNASASGDDATALGANNIAAGQGSTAGGSNNQASASEATAVGQGNTASGSGSTAVGNDNTASGFEATAVGAGNTASGSDSTALGNANTASGIEATAVGENNQATGAVSTALGSDNTASGFEATAVGNSNTASGPRSSAFGVGNTASGSRSTAVGDDNTASAENSTAFGVSNEASGTESTAFGVRNSATGVGAYAAGRDSTASGDSSVALGDGATASGANSIAQGTGAQANAANSAAYGTGAVANLVGEQSFGTSSNTYTMGGITSDQSKARQSGRLQLTTTDAFGHLASDGGAVFSAIARAQAGIAIGIAMEAPSLTGTENFGIRLGYGNYDGDANAIGLSAIGVMCRDCFTSGDRLALDIGLGLGWSEFYNYDSSTVSAARAGVQLTW